MDELTGKTINAVWIDDDEQHYLVFDTDGGLFAYYAEGGCCSESWFYHVLGVDNLIGHTVAEVQRIDDELDPPDEFSRQEVDRLYGVKLRTDAGWVDIEFRNSSNGYYGGWLQRFDCESVESVGARMVRVTGDYTARMNEAWWQSERWG